METKFSSLNLEFDRVLVQLIIPGLTAVVPFLKLFLDNHIEIKQFLSVNLTLSSGIIILLSLVTGLILENIGSWWEVKHYDRKNKVFFNNYEATWESFLCLDYKGKEPSGHRYIRNMLNRMKFELSFGFSLPISAIGYIIWDVIDPIFINLCVKIFVLYVIPILGFYYFVIFEGYSSSKVIANARELLVKKYLPETQKV